jgi:hypothetical protein
LRPKLKATEMFVEKSEVDLDNRRGGCNEDALVEIREIIEY